MQMIILPMLLPAPMLLALSDKVTLISTHSTTPARSPCSPVALAATVHADLAEQQRREEPDVVQGEQQPARNACQLARSGI